MKNKIINLLTVILISGLSLSNNAFGDEQKTKGIIIDIARQNYDIKTIKYVIDTVDKNNGQYVQLHFSDNENYAIESDYLNQNKDNILSKKDVHNIVNYANNKNVQIIPDFDIPAHSKYWISHLKDNENIQTDYDNSTIDFYNNKKANQIVKRQLIEITDLFKQEQFNQKIVIGGDEVPGAIQHQKDFINFLNHQINFLNYKNYQAIIWNDSLTNQYLNAFKYKPQILYWKNTDLTKQELKNKKFNIIDVDFNKNAITLPNLKDDISINEQNKYIYNQKMNDNSAFVIWGEYDQQFNQKQLEQTISPLIKSYLTSN